MKHIINHTGCVILNKTLYCHPELKEPWISSTMSVYSNGVRIYFECSLKVEGAWNCRQAIKDFLEQGGSLVGGRTLDNGTTVAEFEMMKDV